MEKAVGMRYVSINSVPNGSTGGVMRQVTEERRALGDECWCMWGRGRAAEKVHEYNFGSKPELYLDILQTRLDGKAGFHSKLATCRLLKKLDEVRPDIVHLHNIHGYYVNVEMLFDWLATHENVQVKWTLHDCWAFTGHCAYFTYVKCAQWKDHCACSGSCPQLNTYPKTISKKSCSWNFEHKRACFTQLPSERVTLVTPSHWLEGLVKESFLSKYPIEVRHNTIDKSVFKPTPSDFRKRYGIGDRFMILGVASPWTERKGLKDFIRLAEDLNSEHYAIVLVGLSNRQIAQVKERVVALPKTENAVELAEAYTAADLFVHPGNEETFGLTVAESCACGTPVVVAEGSACVEAADTDMVTVIPADMSSLESTIGRLAERR